MLGFIGLGNMGGRMAMRLLERGHQLVVHDVREEVMRPLLNAGAAPATSPAAVADAAEVVLSSLPSPEVARAVALGDGGVHSGRRITTYIDLSTIGAATAADIADRLGSQGIAVLDAPVSGGVKGAEAGTLTVMVAGPATVLAAQREVLEIIGHKVIHVGDRPGMAQTMKVLGQLLNFSAMAVSSEAFVLGAKAGLDPGKMVEVFSASSARNSAVDDKIPRKVLPRTFVREFTIDLAYKDLSLCLRQAEEMRVPMWMGAAVQQLWLYALAQGAGDEDVSAIIKCMEAWSGTEVAAAPPESRGEKT